MSQFGQVIMTGIKGVALSEEEKNFIQQSNIGGVILFAHNYESPAQLAELVNSIQTLRDEYPLFISVDHEGGRVMRFKTQFTHFPAMLDVAKLGSPKLVFELHSIMAEELSVCGINLSFSPCCDVLTNPANKVIGDRSFGEDPIEVEKFVSAAIRGLQTNNVLACGKHFPGHGGTTKDSHFDLPYVKTSLEDLKSKELIPFVKASKSRIEFMMMAHLVVDSIDPDLPCTLSEKAYTFLREHLKYSKLIITDDMEMKAITDHHGVEDAAVKALNAGADILIYRGPEQAMKAYAGIQQALKTKVIKNKLMDEKVERILKCKEEYLKNYSPIYIPGIEKKVPHPKGKDLNNLLRR